MWNSNKAILAYAIFEIQESTIIIKKDLVKSVSMVVLLHFVMFLISYK